MTLLADQRLLLNTNPEQRAAWRRMRMLFRLDKLGGPCDGLRLDVLVYWRWWWKGRWDR